MILSMLIVYSIYFTLVLYVISTLAFMISAQNQRYMRIAWWIGLLGFIVNLSALVMQTKLNGRLPLATGWEFLLCFAAVTVLFFLVYSRGHEMGASGGTVMLTAALIMMAMILLMRDQIGTTAPLMPALQSAWLTSHVLTAVLSYAAFAFAAGLAFLYIRRGSSEAGEYSIYRLVALGFIMLSISIILGAVWAEQTWGSYWTWDPKETWALVTWIIYALYLHLYRRRNWRGKRANLLVVAGFVLVLFTFFGVNFLLTGLHSYV